MTILVITRANWVVYGVSSTKLNDGGDVALSVVP